MEYIHYGDNNFNIDKFKPIVNKEEFTKPYGGLWGSRANTVYGWKDWCLEIKLHTDKLNNYFSFSLDKDSKILTIDNCNQLETLPKNKNSMITSDIWVCLDFEQLAKEYDAIEVLISKDYKLRHQLCGWDCDSILVMNPKIIITND